MPKPKRKRRPSMYKTAAQIRREVRASLDKEIHAATGLPYGAVHAMMKLDARYCIWRKGDSGRKIIYMVANGMEMEDLTSLTLRKRHLELALNLANAAAPVEMHIGVCEVRLMPASKIANHEKVRQWMRNPNPEF